MVVLKNKLFLIGLIASLILFIYLLMSDEMLEEQTAQWMFVFDERTKDHDNASLRLLSLGKKDMVFVNGVKHVYEERLNAFTYDGVLSERRAMQYPNVLQFEAFLDNPLFCDLDEANCLSAIEQQPEYLHIVLNEFQPELVDFMSLSNAASFQALNPFVAEINLADFFFLFKLKGTEIYVDIHEKRLEKAAQELTDLIQINRHFFADSDDLLTKITFSINMERVFQPLLLALKAAGYDMQGQFDDVLRPLSMQEISSNKIQIRSFAKNARLIKAGLAARERNSSGTFLSKIWHQLIYKENMTLNDMFKEYQPLLLPKYVNKASLLSFSKNIDKEIEDTRRMQVERPLLYRLKNITNVVGASLKDVIMPRQINLYESTAKLDTRMQLLRIVLNSQQNRLADELALADTNNYYTGQEAILTGTKLCHEVATQAICVNTAP